MADPDRAKSTIVTISHTLTHAMCPYPVSTYHLCTEKSIVLYALIRPTVIHKTNSDFTIVLSSNRYDFKKHFPMSSNCIIAFFLFFLLSLSHTLFKSLFRKCVGSFCSGHMERERNHYMGPSRGPRSLKGIQNRSLSDNAPDALLRSALL